MGVNGGSLQDGSPGLNFDTGFMPNYWIGVTIGGGGAGPTMYVNYEVLCSNCFGAYLGNVSPSNTPPGNIFVDNQGFGIRAALNNSNTNGVQMDTSGCYANGAPFNPQGVTTGLELAIPLSAIGSPLGQVSILAFFTDQGYSSMYNQVLGPLWDGTPTYCQGSFGAVDSVDFSSLPGSPHYFTLTVPACNDFLLNYASATFGSGGGASNMTVTDSGACSWSVTSNVPWVTITSPLSGSGNGTITYSVASNTTINARTGSLTVSGQFATASMTITENGIFLPPVSNIITIDGIADPAYGCPLAVQQIGTGFGKNTSTNVLSGGVGSGGSELDAAYGLIINNVLFLTIAGNLEGNGNEINLFFMTGPGGHNTLTTNNPAIGGGTLGVLNYMAADGLTFDPGFAPNYWIGANIGTSPYRLYVDYSQIWPGGTNAAGVATNGYYLGQTTSTNGTLSLGSNPFFIEATLNDSNTNGVSGTTCNTNSVGAQQSVAAAQVRSGLELAIPLQAIGSPTGSIAVCAIISGQGPDHNYLSSQLLSPIGTNDPTVSVCQGNLATAATNLGTLPGVPHFFLVGPEMAVKSISVSNSNATVVYQTEANTNMLYRVERASGNYSTNLTWTPLSGFVPGTATGGTLTQVDNSVTSKTNVYYRVRQTPQCQ